MAIRASSAKQVQALIADLSGVSNVKRDAAVARLTVIGARAVARLLEVGASDAGPSARVAAFRALEAIGDPRGLDVALRATGDRDAGVAVAAIGVVRAFVRGEHGVPAVDRLTAIALDQRRPDAVRVAAVRALQELAQTTVAPIMKTLATDRSEAVRMAATTTNASVGNSSNPAAALGRVAETSLPEDPAALRRLIAEAAGTAPLATLLSIVERVRERESNEPRTRRAPWTAARAAAHLALARRDSRLALYDLRETLESAVEPLPVDMLAALSSIGDASCVEAIAAAYTKSKDEWWRDRLRQAFGAIVAREHLTGRHAVMKRIAKKWPAILAT